MTKKVSQSWIRYSVKAVVSLLPVSRVPGEAPEAPPLPQSRPWARAARAQPRWRQRAGCCFRFRGPRAEGPSPESPAVCQFGDPISVLVVPSLVSLGPPILQALFPENRFMSRFLTERLWRTFWTSTSQGESGGLSVVWGRRAQEWHLVAWQGHCWLLIGPSLYPFTFHICCMRLFWTFPACRVRCMYLRIGKLILLI